jgi:hypothetical protein
MKEEFMADSQQQDSGVPSSQPSTTTGQPDPEPAADPSWITYDHIRKSVDPDDLETR